MIPSTADVVICGAGIAGVAAAYHLTVRCGLKNVVIVDERPPLTLTSDKSTECYRNWWPGPGDEMVRFMNRSIDIMEELAHQSGNVFNMNRRGYLYASANPARINEFKRSAAEPSSLGAGPVRLHTGQPGEAAYMPAESEGFASPLTGADIITDTALIRQHFPYLAEDTVAVLHTRRCGWFSAQQYGMYMLEQAQAHGAQLISARVEDVAVTGNKIQAVQVRNGSGSQTIATGNFVIAAGPFLQQAGQMIGVDFPVFSELHIKISMNDHLGVVPRHAPLVIWTDPTHLCWSAEERAALTESEDTRHLLDEFPAGVHTRPEGAGDSPVILILWTYDIKPVEVKFPFAIDPEYAEISLRGLARMIPGLSAYLDRMPKPYLDGGYYTKTKENRPLIGSLPVEGAYVFAALSGFGLMASAAGGELLAAHIIGSDLPAYAPAFSLARYDDPDYQKLLDNWGESGQL